MKEGNNYCGLDCGELLEKQQELLDLCIEHAKYDRYFAPIMVQKLIDQAMKVKMDLMKPVTVGDIATDVQTIKHTATI